VHRETLAQATVYASRAISDSSNCIAIFNTEGFAADGERMGYVDLFDTNLGDTVAAPGFDDTEFITEGAARRLATERGWRFKVDAAPTEDVPES
jgi:arginine/ornithine N-succinyltransferase beta subunit